MPPNSRLACRPLSSDQLADHFRAAEALIGRALDSQDEVIVDLRTANPTTRSDDEWRLSVASGPLLDADHIEFGAQFLISLLVDYEENYNCGDVDYEPVWEESRETHLFDRDWRTITCAFAAWLLRAGWIFVNGELTAGESIECDFSIAPEGNLLCTQKVRTHGTPPIAPPHSQRANELRKAWRDQQPRKLSEQEAREKWERYLEEYGDEEPWF